jgi:hypothetical protein
MNRIILAGLALAIAAPAAAQTPWRPADERNGVARLYGSDGRYQGRIETNNRGTQRLYDESGRRQGRAERQSDGDIKVYDETGRYRGRIDRDEELDRPQTRRR